MLRGWLYADEHERAAFWRFVINQIVETGLEPVAPPEPLPPINPADVGLLCWLGIKPQGADTRFSSKKLRSCRSKPEGCQNRGVAAAHYV